MLSEIIKSKLFFKHKWAGEKYARSESVIFGKAASYQLKQTQNKEILTVKKMILFAGLFFMLTVNVHAGETATPQEIYAMVLKGVEVMQALGEEGLQAFNDPKGEFAWKDTYVQVYNCEAKKIVGHINPKLLTWTSEKFSSIQDKKGNYITKLICDASKNPKGGWVEYWWPKAGETEPSRKITFVVQVPGRPYQVSAGIYDDKVSIEELSKINM